MKYVSLTFIFSVYLLGCSGQGNISNKPKEDLPSQKTETTAEDRASVPLDKSLTMIDSLNSAADVLDFYKHYIAYDKDDDPYELGTFSSSDCQTADMEALIKLEKTHDIKSYYKKDIDADGRTDLLLNLENKNRYSTENDCLLNPMIIFNPAPDSITVFTLNLNNQEKALAFLPDQKNQINVIQNGKIKNLYAYHGLILESPTINAHANITKIEFEAGPCFGTCPIFNLILNKKDVSIFKAEMYNFKHDRNYSNTVDEGEFFTQINDETWKAIEKVINVSNFKNLKDDYGNYNVTDQPSYNMKVYYENGDIKEVHDYGRDSDYTVNSLIQYFMNMRWALGWNRKN